MYNIRQITNNSLKDFETVVIEGVPYAIIPASYLGEGIVKLGFCLTNPADFGSSFFITVNEEEQEIKVGKTGIYELNVDSYYDKKHEIHVINPTITELKLPKFKNFTFDYATSGEKIKIKVSIPTLNTSNFIYNGEEIIPDISEIDSEIIKISGDRVGRDAKKYNMIFTLKDENYIWEDNTDTPKKIQWEIKKQPVTLPTVEPLYYSGEEITPDWENLDSSKIEISGITKAIEAGIYTTLFNVKPNYQWEDGSYNQKEVQWEIRKKEIGIPMQSYVPSYSNNKIDLNLENFDDNEVNIVGGVTSAKNAGEYTVLLKPKQNYCWTDGTEEIKEIVWKINKQTLYSTPYNQNSNLQYTGNKLYPTWSGYDENVIYVSYEGAISVGNHEAIAHIIDDNYCWSNGGSDQVIYWEIKRKNIEYPTLNETTFIYNGENQFPTYNINQDEIQITYEPDTAIDCSSSYYYSFRPKENYCWQNGATDNYYLYWSITAQIVTSLPQATDQLIYNGEAQVPNWEYDESLIEINSNVSRTDAGNYSSVFYLKNYNYLWSNNSRYMEVPWEIRKKQTTLTLSEQNITFDNEDPYLITISSELDNLKYKIKNANPLVVKATIEGNNINITPLGGGETNISVYIDNKNIEAPEQNIHITCSLPEIEIPLKSFSEATDEELAIMGAASAQGLIDLKEDAGWSTGDSRIVEIDNIEGMEGQNAGSYTFVILDDESGYELNDPIGEQTRTQFFIGMKNCFKKTGVVYSSGNPGWETSSRRNWCNNQFREALPAGFRSLFKEVKVPTVNSYSNSTVTNTIDYFFLPTEKESANRNGYGMFEEYNSSNLKYYKYYQLNGVAQKSLGDESSSKAEYWTRSLYGGGSNTSSYNGVTITSSGNSDYWNSKTRSCGITVVGCV